MRNLRSLLKLILILSISAWLTACGGSSSSNGAAPPRPMYFSEYIEGTGNNKALEIYNPLGGNANLNDCEVRIYNNGSTTAVETVPLSGNLNAGSVYSLCRDSIDPLVFDPANCNQITPSGLFNGNDAVELACAGTTLDVIGQIGLDPGLEWNDFMGVGTQDETLRRKCAVKVGDNDGGDVFAPSSEWASFSLDNFIDLGQYSCP